MSKLVSPQLGIAGRILAGNTVAKRLVFHIGGYDPITSPDFARQRFVREIARFQRTWSVKALVEDFRDGPDQRQWSVTTTGPNWRVQTDYHLIRWDDVIDSFRDRATGTRIALGIIAFWDFVFAGALWAYFRANWGYAAFFLYPYVTFGLLILTALSICILAFKISGSVPVAIGVGFLGFIAVMAGAWRRLHIGSLFDDWIFSREYVRWGNSTIEKRLDKLATELVAAARNSDADEILIVGHSLGAALAVDLLDRALKLDNALGRRKIPLTLITIGSSILKIGLHRAATRFRATVERVAVSPGIFWGDYQARIDLMNFYNCQPMSEMGLSVENEPVVRLVEIGRMLEHATYRRFRLDFFRLHCQFVSGNDKRASYDYFMLVCGPVSARSQTLDANGAVAMIGEDGALIKAPLSVVEPLSARRLDRK